MFYTSGRTSNEAAFLYQLMIRSYGTNNMPDCSNMCHESSGSALTESIGIGKGSVTVPDLENADLILIAGQNPGTNHPRMLSTLEKAKSNGAKIIAINPLPEAGLRRFKDPQKVSGVIGHGVNIADEFLQIRLGGDMALFQGLGKLLLEQEDRAPGTVVDRAFVDRYCAGWDEYEKHIRAVDLDTVLEATGPVDGTARGNGCRTCPIRANRHLLGHGDHSAHTRSRHHRRSSQPAAHAWNDGQTRCRRLSGARTLQCPG